MRNFNLKESQFVKVIDFDDVSEHYKKQLILKEDIILNPNEGMLYNTGINISFEHDLLDESCISACVVAESSSAEESSEALTYLAKGSTYRKGDDICIYFKNLTNDKIIIKKNTDIATVYLHYEYFKIDELLEKYIKENEIELYRYNGVIIKEYQKNRISEIEYLEDMQNGNYIKIHLSEN